MPTRILVALALVIAPNLSAADLLLKNVRIYDGTGGRPFTGDVRIRADRIAAVAPRLDPAPGEAVRDEHGLALAPGFIDMHSHGSRGLSQDPDAATITRQGVTTIVVGQDGGSAFPLRDFLEKLDRAPAAINVASMAGHATLREQAMGKDLFRPCTEDELAKMKNLLSVEMQSGAFGLSTGLEYEEGHFASTGEIVELSKIAAAAGGFYISHVRDEGKRVFDSFDEILRIGRDAKIPVEITHIKLGATAVWHAAAGRMPTYFERAKREHIPLKADVYPYNYWYSTIRVLLPDRDFFNPAKVAAALADNGGASAIRLVRYTPEPAMAGKTLDRIAAQWGVTPAEAYMRIVKETMPEAGADEDGESIIGTTMSEDDVRWFIAQPGIMFCSDGELHGAHPRGAGAFPRILGRYVREEKVVSLESAVHKMTGLSARQLGLKDRGRIAPGFIADLVLFDPHTVIDRSTIEKPEEPPAGIPGVMVSGEWVIDGGKVTGKHPGKALRRR